MQIKGLKQMSTLHNTEFPHDESIPETMSETEQLTEELIIIAKEEIRKVISLLKNNKVTMSDFITAEVLKVSGEPIVNML